MGILQCSTGPGMPPPPLEACFSIWRAKPSRTRFWFCKVLKTDFKCCRVPAGSKELLVLEWAVSSSLEHGKWSSQPLSKGGELPVVICSAAFGFWEFLCTHTLSLQSWQACWDLQVQAPCLWPSTTAGECSVSLRVFFYTGRREVQCWAQMGSGCACVYPSLLWVRSWPREHKRGCVRVYSELWHLKWCLVAKCGTAKFFQGRSSSMYLPALMCNSS